MTIKEEMWQQIQDTKREMSILEDKIESLYERYDQLEEN